MHTQTRLDSVGREGNGFNSSPGLVKLNTDGSRRGNKATGGGIVRGANRGI